MRIIFKDGQILNLSNVDTLVIQDAEELGIIDKALRERMKVLRAEIADLEESRRDILMVTANESDR